MCLKKYSSGFEPFTLAFSTVSFEKCLYINHTNMYVSVETVDYGYYKQGLPGVKSQLCP